MEQFQHISVIDAFSLMQNKQQEALLFDTRDSELFEQSHPLPAKHFKPEQLSFWCENLEFDKPLLFICYRGNSSQGVAQYFVNAGFEQVYSVDGGFAAWQLADLPTASGKN